MSEMIDLNEEGQERQEQLFPNDFYELEASHSFLSYFINVRNAETLINFAENTLENVLEGLKSNERVILYLHKRNDPFSTEFCKKLTDKDVEDILGDSSIFTIIAWELPIGNNSIRQALTNAITSVSNTHFSDYVSTDKSVVLLIDNSKTVIESFEEISKLACFVSILQNYQETVHRINGDKPLDYSELMNSTNCQQRTFELLGDRDYDSFERNQHDLLRCKIGYHLYGPPNLLENDKANISDGGYSYEGAKAKIDKLLKIIVDQNNKYCKWNGRVVIGFIYVCAEPLAREKQKRKKEAEEKKKEANEEKIQAEQQNDGQQSQDNHPNNQIQDYYPDRDFQRIPLFVIRKCKGKDHPGPFCRLFIDEDCRVYQSWADYLKNNKLPPCLMVCPYQGKYQSLNDNGDVSLEEHFSPCTSTSKKVLGLADTGMGIAGVVAGGIVMFAAAPIVVTGAVIAGVGSGIYAASRGIGTLVDRHQHAQDILNLRDAECRGAIITIAGSALALSMMGSIKLVSYLAANGVAVGQGTRLLLYGLNALTLGINGVGIGNTIYEMWQRGEMPSTLQVLQLGASVFFFGNSVYNFRAIGTVIDESQARALSEIEGYLSSNRMRRMFNKMLQETMRLEGNTAGKAEVISAMRNMIDPIEVIRILNRNNKNFNSAGVRFAVQDGNIVLNGQKVDIMDMSKMSSYDKSSFLRGLPPIPDNLTPNVSYSINAEFTSFLQEHSALFRLTTLATGSISTFVRDILSAFEPAIRKLIYSLSLKFMEKLGMEGMVENVAKLFPGTDVYLLILRWICNALSHVTAFKKICDEKRWNDDDINNIMENLMPRFRTWFADVFYDKQYQEDRKEKRCENNIVKQKKNCTECGGYYYN